MVKGDQAILLVSWAGTIHFAKYLLQTGLANYSRPIVVVVNEVEKVTDHETFTWLMDHYHTIPIDGNRWEVGGLEAMVVFSSFQEWVLIQDTLEVIDPRIFDVMFDQFPNRSVAFGPGWQCYLGKYRREVLMQFPLPTVLNKMDACYWEQVLSQMYGAVAKEVEGEYPHVLFPDWDNANPKNTTEFSFGRNNLVLYNPYVIKRKSTEWLWPSVNLKVTVDHMGEPRSFESKIVED
jgi:hypothetical protein